MTLVNLFALFYGFPTLLKYLGFMRPDFVPLNEYGNPWTVEDDEGTEPIYTAQKPSDKAAAVAAGSVLYSLFNFLK